MNSLHLRASAVFTAALFLIVPHAASAREVAGPARPDLLVVGGTPAGVAAAVAAARRGEDVTLVASGEDLGGVLTGAMMDQWDLNVAPDADAAAIQGGIFGEIYADLGDVFTPADAARTFADLVAAQPRITVRYGESPLAVQTTPLRDGRCIDDITFRSERTGALTQLSAPYVVDATDFGDVAALADAPYDLGRQDSGLDNRMQAVTLMFTIEGVAWDTLAASYDPQTDGPGGALGRRAWGYSKIVAHYDPLSSNVLVRDLNLGRTADGAVSVNAIDVVGIDGLRARDLAEARHLAEREAPRLVAFLRARLPGFADARVGQFAPDLYVRETRHFAGLERLTTADVWLGKIPADSIGLSSYPIDLHPVDASDAQPFAPVRHIYGVPFGAMLPRGTDNLVLAGPAISASHLASGSARVIPTTIEEGEAAGAAAADADRAGIDFVTLATHPQAMAALRRDLGAHDVVIALPASLRDASPAVVARRADPAYRRT